MAANASNTITVIGVGRLGLCAALVWEKKGYSVLGVDVFPSYVDSINKKSMKSHEPLVSEWLQKSQNLRATLDLDEGLRHSNIIMVLVPTPTGVGEKSYDHSTLSKVLDSINERKVADKHVIIGCTVLPGYIANVGRYLLRDCVNTTLSYNPEFIAQGDIIRGFLNPDIVLIGEGSKEIGDILEEIYLRGCENKPKICRMSPESAEITKLSINCFITTKIAFANFIGDIADRTPNADKYKILDAVGGDSRIGNKYLFPGYGFGGPCFPRDNRALGNYAKMLQVDPLLPDSTDNSNRLHALTMVENFLRENKDLYVFENVTYKENCKVPIIEESQKLEVAKRLVKAGKKVLIKDKKHIIAEVIREYGSMFQYEIVD